MSEHKEVDKSEIAEVPGEASPEDVEAAILAGGHVVGTTADNEPLVEGPNSK